MQSKIPSKGVLGEKYFGPEYNSSYPEDPFLSVFPKKLKNFAFFLYNFIFYEREKGRKFSYEFQNLGRSSTQVFIFHSEF